MVLRHDCKHLVLVGREKVERVVRKEIQTREIWECELGIEAHTSMRGCPR